MAIVMGIGHELVSEYLKRGRKFCIDYINIYPEGILKAYYGDNYEEYFSTIQELTLKEGIVSGRVLRDPKLERRTNVESENINFISPERKS